jgi:hypothetical protein
MYKKLKKTLNDENYKKILQINLFCQLKIVLKIQTYLITNLLEIKKEK